MSEASTSESTTSNSTPHALPAPSHSQTTTASQDAAGQTTTINVGDFQPTSLLDKLGPLVVNNDGTLSRIHNWENMTVDERERTVRVLGKRNKLRLDEKKAELETETKSIA